MESVLKAPSQIIDVNAKIIANLNVLNAAHLEDKAICLAKGIPLYACVNAGKKIWTKELKNGQVFRVKRHLDNKRDVVVDTIID